MVVARLSNLLILAIALTVMANLGSIQTAWFVSLLFGAGMGSVLVLRWIWERITLYSEIAAMATSLVLAPVLLVTLGTDPETEWLRLGLMAAASTAAAVGITFVTPATEPAVLDAFFQKVNPPGFWSKTAARAGIPPGIPLKDLRNGLFQAGAMSLSLFLLLVGCGRLLIPPPEALTGWSWIFIAAGLVLMAALGWKKRRQ